MIVQCLDSQLSTTNRFRVPAEGFLPLLARDRAMLIMNCGTMCGILLIDQMQLKANISYHTHSTSCGFYIENTYQRVFLL